jgi:proline iminopeptidase
MHGFIPVSGGHTIYYEIHGTGRPAVDLHGGPGGGINHNALQQYNLKKWCVVLFDQRGCGKSTPTGELSHNTTWDLIHDMETLRIHLGFESWFISGGSWGSTLALVYAETYPQRVSGLLLRGLCLCNRASNAWLYEEGGVSHIYPNEWDAFISMVPSFHRSGWKKILRYYQRQLKGPFAQRYADAWWGLERRISRLIPFAKNDLTKKETLVIAKIENHYFVHDCWLKDDQILKGLSALRHIPITIVHGRYDMICPITGAITIQKMLPHTKLIILPDEGHVPIKPKEQNKLRQSTDRMFRTTQKSSYRKRRTIKSH